MTPIDAKLSGLAVRTVAEVPAVGGEFGDQLFQRLVVRRGPLEPLNVVVGWRIRRSRKDRLLVGEV